VKSFKKNLFKNKIKTIIKIYYIILFIKILISRVINFFNSFKYKNLLFYLRKIFLLCATKLINTIELKNNQNIKLL